MESEKSLLQQCTQIIEAILSGKARQTSPLPDSLAQSDEERHFATVLNQLLLKLQEGMVFVQDICEGRLGTTSPPKNHLIGPIKQLHADLRHLVWQTERLAAGDLNQRVDFLGSFSDAFNSLIASLRERKDLMEQLRSSEAFYKTLIRTAPDGICIIDLEGKILYISQTGYEMFGYSNHTEPIGVNFLELIAPDYREQVQLLINILLQGNSTGINEYQVIHKNGEVFWNESNMSLLRNDNDEIEAIMIVFRDHSSRKLMEQQLREYSWMMENKARTDQMTGLLNHAEGMELLSRELERVERAGSTLLICFVDMDGLKYINDHFGHNEGDRMILALTDCIRECIRKSDYVCRMGGDEFLIIFPECKMPDTLRVLERIQEKVDTMNATVDFRHPLSFSYGFGASTPEARVTPESLLKSADDSMYVQKRNKKSQRT